MNKFKDLLIDFIIIFMVVVLITLAVLLDLANQLSANDISKLEKVDFTQIKISDIIGKEK